MDFTSQLWREERGWMVSRRMLQRISLYQGKVADCSWVQHRLGGYVHRDLPDSELHAIEKRVRRCPKCSADCEEFRRVRDWLAEEFLRQRGVTSSSEERVSGIMARIEHYEAEFTEKGEYILPVLDWVEEDKEKLDVVFLSLRKTAPLEAAPIPVEEVPEGYVESISTKESLAESVLVDIAVSSGTVGTGEFEDLSRSATSLLQECFYTDPTHVPGTCQASRPAITAGLLRSFFRVRSEVLRQECSR